MPKKTVESKTKPVSKSSNSKEELEHLEFQAQQAHLATMLDQTFDAMIIWEYDGVIKHWNKGAQEIYRYTKHEALGKVIHELLKTIQPIPISEIKKTLLEKGRWEGELIHTDKSGILHTVSSKKVLITEKDGRKFILETNRDITEQKKAEIEHARLAAIIESSDDAIVSKNLEGVVTSWNKGAEKIFGYKEEEMVGKSIRTIIPEELQSEENNILATLRSGKKN
jgi:PAS domain S-box-containing protein